MENKIEKVTLTKIYTTDKDKNGNTLMNKNNKPYTRMSIKCLERGDVWISGFQGKENQGWRESDVVEVIIKQNGQYLNFEVPKVEDKMAGGLEKMMTQLAKIEAKINYIAEALKLRDDAQAQSKEAGPDTIDYPEETINPEDIPF